VGIEIFILGTYSNYMINMISDFRFHTAFLICETLIINKHCTAFCTTAAVYVTLKRRVSI
jgi:hypothetical protein